MTHPRTWGLIYAALTALLDGGALRAQVRAQVAGCLDDISQRIGNLNFQGGGVNYGGGSLTADGKTLYYDSWMPAGGQSWIVKVTRNDVDQPFAGGERLGPVALLCSAGAQSAHPGRYD